MLNPQGKIYVVLEKLDMRKGINGLSIRVSVQYEKNPGDGRFKFEVQQVE